jgi:hypothetical protein
MGEERIPREMLHTNIEGTPPIGRPTTRGIE